MKLIHFLHPPLPLPSFKEASQDAYKVAGIYIEPQGYLYANLSFEQFRPPTRPPVPSVPEPSVVMMLTLGLGLIVLFKKFKR